MRKIPGLIVDQATSRRLARMPQRDTSPELAVRRHLTKAGIRYRTRNRDLPGSPDLANRRGRWALFVHGCFWHRHPDCPRATTPTRNQRFWLDKFAANTRRDERVLSELRSQGFLTAVVWECETVTAERLAQTLAPILAAIVPADLDHTANPNDSPR